MNRIIGCVILYVLFSLPASGQNPRQQIVLLSGQTYSDVSIDSLDGKDLLITSADNTLRIPIDSIARVNTPGSGRVLRVVSIGLLGGAAVGFIAGMIIDGANEPDPLIRSSGSDPETNYKLILPIAAGLLGAGIGAIAGSSGGGSQVDLAGLDAEEKRRILLSMIHKTELQ